MFRGASSLNIDAKGRLAVPSRYRDRIVEICGGRLIVTIGLLTRSLVVYLFPDWQTIEAELENLPALDAKAQAIRHLLIGHAAECDMDGHGRILVPPALREFASLGKRITMVGQGNKFELWDEAAWGARRDALLGEVGELLVEPSDAMRALVL